jgi:hypothetical protein
VISRLGLLSPPYLALSYTWVPPGEGSTESDIDRNGERYGEIDKIPVYINSRVFYVFPNLFDAILQLRRSYPDQYFWINALCICQDDVQERSNQVAIMELIYANAWKTFVWLGKETPMTKTAVYVLRRSREAAG